MIKGRNKKKHYSSEDSLFNRTLQMITNCQMNGCPVKIIKVTSCLICNKIGTKKPFDGPCEMTTLMRTGRLVRTTNTSLYFD
jgi:hypothetical protein